MPLAIPWSERAKPKGNDLAIDVPVLGRRYSSLLRLSHKLSICVNCAVGVAAGGVAIGVVASSSGTTMDIVFQTVFLVIYGAFAFLICYPLARAAHYQGIREIKGGLISKRCQICVHCFYDLSARPRDEDTCPECGVIAPRRECVRLWCKLLRSRF